MIERHERKARILVLEDNPADVDLLRRALGAAEVDCELTVIDDGAEALTLVREAGEAALLALVIIDLNLPKHSGIEILKEMRANQRFSHLPVIVLSSSVTGREKDKMDRFHVERFVTKPLDLDEFLGIGLIVKELLADR